MTREEAIEIVKTQYPHDHVMKTALGLLIPELRESEDERIRKALILHLQAFYSNEVVAPGISKEMAIAYLEKQKENKEINLANILKHYPKETELYSPLYGKLWLAEVDETNGVITCYKYPLEKDDVRATLKQEDTVSFYSNGTTGLPDFNVSEDCMLFLYDTKKQKEPKDPFDDEQFSRGYEAGKHDALRGQVDAFVTEYNKGFDAGRFEGLTAGYNKAVKEMEQKEQKPVEWSEEDKKTVDAAIYWLKKVLSLKEVDDILTDDCPISIRKTVDKLKSLHLQPKQKLNKKDKKILLSLHHIMNCADAQNAVKRDGLSVEDVCNFLFSIEPYWKPSKEHVNAVRYFINKHQSEAWAARGQWKEFTALRNLLGILEKLM